ncbi:zinc knuckle, partial [Cooperia oncophora]
MTCSTFLSCNVTEGQEGGDVSAEAVEGEPEVEMSVPVNVVDEPEKERLTGEAAEPQVWHEIIKKVRAISTHVTVEVAKHMRTSDPKREAIETVCRQRTEEAVEELNQLQQQVRQGAELEQLQPAPRVCRISYRVNQSFDVVQQVTVGEGGRIDDIVEKCRSVTALENQLMMLQEKLRSYDAQLAELQALRKRCENQEKELEKLRQHQRSPVDMEIDGEKPGKSGNKRTVPSFGEAMQYLNRLQSGLTQPKGSSLQTGGQRHASELELRSVDANSSCSQPGAPKRETGRLSFCTDSDVSECQSSRGRREVAREGASAQKGDDPVARYMRHMTLPEVQPYSGQDSNYGFVRFLEDFQLKYPRTNWTDAELCTLFRSKLVGKARTLYEALPSYEKDGGYDALIEAMMRECKAEQRTIKVVALGRLKRLKKRDGQTVSDFCVELEQLTRQAYPELDEYTLAVERATFAVRSAIALARFALESEEDTYEKLKEVAKRIERRDMTLEQVKNPRTGEGKAFSKPPRIKEPDLKDRKNVQDRTTREPDFKERRNAQDRTPVCYKCREAGHMARDCKKTKIPSKPGSSLSTRVRGGCCITAEERDTGSSQRPQTEKSPLFGKKMTVELELLGIKARGLLDTGSEITILPGKVLLRAKRAGFDIDRALVEHEIDQTKRVYDASGSAMQFVAVLEVPIRDCSSGRKVSALVHVSRVKDDMVILGTNVLPMFGYQLTREGRPLDNPTKTETGAWLQEVVPTIPNPTVAKVARREYIAPGAMSWVQLTGCDKDADWLLDSGIQLIHSGVCHVKKDGLVEVPVINRSSAPVVLKEGESVGQWKEYQTEWIEASAKDIPTDMLTLETRRLSAQQRLMKLKQFLKENRKERKLPA